LDIQPDFLSSNDQIASEKKLVCEIRALRVFKLNKRIAKKILLKLNRDVLRDLIALNYFLYLRDYLKCLDCELLVFNNQKYYKIIFESKVMLSILLGREGNLINFIASRNQFRSFPGKIPVKLKFLDSQDIKSLERLLYKKFFSGINLERLKNLFKDIFEIELYGQVEWKKGNIAVFNKQIAYELFFSSRIRFSLYIDNHGNYLDIAAAKDNFKWENFSTGLFSGNNIMPALNLFNRQKHLNDRI
jgi:hypothetical protein